MLKVAKVIGLNSDTDAALSYISSPQRREGEEDNCWRLYLLISASLDDAFSQSRRAIYQAEDVFFSSSQPLKERLQTTFEAIQNFLKQAEDLEIIAGLSEESLSADNLYLYYLGSSVKAYLFREDKVTDLLQLAPSCHLVSGIIKSGDRIIFSTSNFEELWGQNFKELVDKPLEEIVEEGEARLSQAQTYQLAAVVLEKEGQTVEEIVPLEKLISSPLSVASSLSLASLLTYGENIKLLIRKALLKRPRSLKGAIFLVGVVLLIVWGGVLTDSKRRQDAQVKASFEDNFVKATLEYQKAWSLKDSDSASSSQSLNQAKIWLAQALQIKPADREALELKKQIEENSPLILKVFSPSDFSVWMDLNLIKKDFTSYRLSLSHGKILFLDPQKKILVKVDLATKAPQILAGEEKLGQAALASLNGDQAVVFSPDKGIVSIDTISGKTTLAAKPDLEWGEIVDIYGFAGNIYLLDKPPAGSANRSGGQILKYLPVETGYTEKRSYLKEGVKADFSEVKRMHIDGSIWLFKGEEEILKYTAGSLDYFSLSNLDKPLKDVHSFFASDQTENIYFLDKGNSRLIVVDKKGAYRTQYSGDKFATFDDLVVDEKSKKIYLLGDNKIFQIELK
ncbi:MAG: hypothetical protein UU73_C0002G0089 [Candidatus Daviesbacteria bacterium GW2011_GWA1_41_61]|uniref:Uncharacterized protein n=1 Tax=Candidatus Daviesbacteria bacterium GW2011_GWA2_40_9 TaxID=1618424 RepID=A0A0G0U6G2_9BACT|nr:MAG: hypothetical protein UU26_C0010G0010 [Candidatus Daviesbacteria bacterium GW2011_GWC1_40_9]KKR82786.1 MAG: hypothetical protein UU29_C0009G0057 [Candidatus Daviesbacteria bacterium GW2011_GWA2_40_9]KKR93749.1 MAG: hypothetical protein UU44_C0001G0089 [Candidatus Daviesbacteria bacterium GW2011_GWB1_41_15]KKS15215.1 MAG: hypothetical protein UU73_C0002G0089 [Candidatus Daviesbacteria bacterium GW2011_GWA1_41_61]